jgi:hypothetical protein
MAVERSQMTPSQDRSIAKMQDCDLAILRESDFAIQKNFATS